MLGHTGDLYYRFLAKSTKVVTVQVEERGRDFSHDELQCNVGRVSFNVGGRAYDVHEEQAEACYCAETTPPTNVRHMNMNMASLAAHLYRRSVQQMARSHW